MHNPETPRLDFHIANNAEPPAVLLTRESDGQILAAFPLHSKQLVIDIALPDTPGKCPVCGTPLEKL